MTKTKESKGDIIDKIDRAVSEVTENGERWRVKANDIRQIIKALYPNDSKSELDDKFVLFVTKKYKDPDVLELTRADIELLNRHSRN